MAKFQDLTGKVFGRLTVIKRAEDYISPKGKKFTQWLCECSCKAENNIKTIMGGSLRSGITQSCGCLQKEKSYKVNRKYNTYNLTGDYGIGYTSKGKEFYFDLEDFDKIKDYRWYIKDGYIQTMELKNDYDKRKTVYMHRLVMNCPDGMEVDHIYHKTFDNRKEFLRIVTHYQNCMNKDLQSNNSSGVTAVYWDKNYKKWKAHITTKRKQNYLGSFNTFDEAVEVRKQAEEKYFKEYKYKKIVTLLEI